MRLKIFISIIYFIVGLQFCYGQSQIKLTEDLSMSNVFLIKVYKYDIQRKCDQSKAVSIVYNQRVSPCFEFVKNITGEKIQDLITLLTTKSTFGEQEYACFNTDYGLLYLDSKKNIIGYTNISFACSNLISNPKIKAQYQVVHSGIKPTSLKKIAKILEVSDKGILSSQISPY